MKTLNHDDEISGPRYGWDGGALTVTRVTPNTIARIFQIRRNAEQVVQAQAQTDAIWTTRFGTAA